MNPISFAPVKAIAYSIFGNLNSFELPFYLRGLYFNARMNQLIYPEWQTWVYIQNTVYDRYEKYFTGIPWVSRIEVLGEAPLCESMLWRMRPLFAEGVTHLLCRDADAITTYKEAQAVQEWVDSGLGYHGITDNPAHGLPMMGGMIGVRTEHFAADFPQFNTFEKLIKRFNLSQRGSDQQLLMADIYPKAKGNMMGHFFQGCKEQVKITKNSVSCILAGVEGKLWESNLTCRHIGSAGVVDFETLRFFKRFDKTDYSEFEKEHSDICHWAK